MCCGNRYPHSCGAHHARDRVLIREEIRDLEEYKGMLEMELGSVNAEIERRKKKEENV